MSEEKKSTEYSQTQRRIRVGVYSGEARPVNPVTGVNKHMERMLNAMESQSDFDATFCVPKDALKRDLSANQDTIGSHVPFLNIPVTRRRLLLNALVPFGTPFDAYTPDLDWVYAPREILCNTRSAKFAVTVHDIYHFEPERRSRLRPRAVLRFHHWFRAISHANVVFTVSHFSKERICEVFGAPEEKIVVVGNGVAPLYYQIASEEPESVSPLPGKTYYLSIGGITRKKGGARLLAFSRRLKRYYPDQLLVVIGIVEPEFEARIVECDNLTVIPRGLPDDLVSRWVRGAAAMLCFSEYEGFGIPAAEGMAAGVPVIVHRQGALAEVVGDAGMVIDADSPRDLDDAFLVARDRAMRDGMIARGHFRASLFHWERSERVFLDELRVRS